MVKQTIQVADKPTLDEVKSLVENNVADKTTNDAIKSLLENTTYGLNAIKKSVSDGKTLVASAITEKGVATTNDATFQTMANNVKNIKVGNKITIDGVEIEKDLKLKTKLTYCNNDDSNKLSVYFSQSSKTAIYYRGELYNFTSSEVYKTDKNFSNITKVTSPTFNYGINIACVYKDCIYCCDNGNGNDFYKYNGSTWTKIVSPDSKISNLFSSDRYLYCFANSGGHEDYKFYRYDGTTWTSIGSFGYFSSELHPNSAISRENGDDIYQVSFYRVKKWNGGTSYTEVVGSPPESLKGMDFIDVDNIHGYVQWTHYYYDGTSWKSEQIPYYTDYYTYAVNYNYGLNVGLYWDSSNSRYYMIPHSVIGYVIES